MESNDPSYPESHAPHSPHHEGSSPLCSPLPRSGASQLLLPLLAEPLQEAGCLPAPQTRGQGERPSQTPITITPGGGKGDDSRSRNAAHAEAPHTFLRCKGTRPLSLCAGLDGSGSQPSALQGRPGPFPSCSFSLFSLLTLPCFLFPSLLHSSCSLSVSLPVYPTLSPHPHRWKNILGIDLGTEIKVLHRDGDREGQNRGEGSGTWTVLLAVS